MARFSRGIGWAVAALAVAAWFAPRFPSLLAALGALALLVLVVPRRRPKAEPETEPAAPEVPERCGTVRVEARYAPAAGATMGGDLYDVVHTPFGVRAIIGDVTGHGATAVDLATDVLTAYRDLVRHEPGLPGIAERLDGYLAARIPQPTERFVTAALVQIPDGSSTAELLGCGHPSPLVLRGGRVRAVAGFHTALPLGLHDLADGWPLPSSIPFDQGDALLLYTDGATEARNPQGDEYPLAERVALLSTDDPGEFLDRLVADLGTHTGGPPHDDVALLLLRKEQADTPARPQAAGRQSPQNAPVRPASRK